MPNFNRPPSGHVFSQVPQTSKPRSVFDMDSDVLTTFDEGYLVPFWNLEYLPGDTLNVSAHLFGRVFSPLQFPIFDTMYLETFFFAVPNRIVQDNWVKIMGEQRNPADSIDFHAPYSYYPTGSGYLNSSLQDYFSLPTEVPGDGTTISHNTYLMRGYNLIYNTWFRDQNLQNSVVVDYDDGPDNPADYVLLRRGKRHDYFTSCLPWPQKGAAVTVTLTGNAPVKGLYVNAVNTVAAGGVAVNGAPAGIASVSGGAQMYAATASPAGTAAATAFNTTNALVYADMTNLSVLTINQLRLGEQIQVLLERSARGGTRYPEIVKAQFGVTSPDSRWQWPEFLGGGHSPLQVSPIAQTSSTASEPSPAGSLTAFATVAGLNHGFVKSFTEHGYIIGIVNVRSNLTYQQGEAKHFARRTRYDWYTPDFANLGEQAVLNREIYFQGAAAPTVDNNAFGYQERAAEYRYKPSIITGQFRSNYAQSLDFAHLAQDFGSLPTLNNTFIVEDAPVDRVVAVPSYPHFIMNGYVKCRAARVMPLYGIPSLGGRL